MKRLHILLLLLVLVGGAARWTYQPESTTVLPTAPVSPSPTTSSGVVVTGEVTGTGEMELTGGSVQSGKVDDTELPLDKASVPEDIQMEDPEVEEIIDLLEELIAENE